VDKVDNSLERKAVEKRVWPKKKKVKMQTTLARKRRSLKKGSRKCKLRGRGRGEQISREEGKGDGVLTERMC